MFKSVNKINKSSWTIIMLIMNVLSVAADEMIFKEQEIVIKDSLIIFKYNIIYGIIYII